MVKKKWDQENQKRRRQHVAHCLALACKLNGNGNTGSSNSRISNSSHARGNRVPASWSSTAL